MSGTVESDPMARKASGFLSGDQWQAMKAKEVPLGMVLKMRDSTWSLGTKMGERGMARARATQEAWFHGL